MFPPLQFSLVSVYIGYITQAIHSLGFDPLRPSVTRQYKPTVFTMYCISIVFQYAPVSFKRISRSKSQAL